MICYKQPKGPFYCPNNDSTRLISLKVCTLCSSVLPTTGLDNNQTAENRKSRLHELRSSPLGTLYAKKRLKIAYSSFFHISNETKVESLSNSRSTLNILFRLRSILSVKPFQFLVEIHILFINIVDLRFRVICSPPAEFRSSFRPATNKHLHSHTET